VGPKTVRTAAAVVLSAGLVLGSWTGAGAAPRTGTPTGPVRVIGFARGTPGRGGISPVTVTVRGRAAARIRAAVASLPPGRPAVCMGNWPGFELRWSSGHSTVQVEEWVCPTPGVVTVRRGPSSSVRPATCALARAVVAVLPRGRARGSREAAAGACRLDPGRPAVRVRR
jgi:hypothetical protein